MKWSSCLYRGIPFIGGTQNGSIHETEWIQSRPGLAVGRSESCCLMVVVSVLWEAGGFGNGFCDCCTKSWTLLMSPKCTTKMANFCCILLHF